MPVAVTGPAPHRRRWKPVALLVATACRGHGGTDDAWAPTTSTESTGAATSSTDGSSGETSLNDTSSTGVADTSTDDGSTTGDVPMPADRARYPSATVHSPITEPVAARLAALRADHPERRDDVFMKVGASSDASTSNLHCFAGDAFDLGAHEALAPTRDHFAMGDADGTTPFDRDSLATEAGRSAGWAIEGAPSPLAAELDAIAPGIALVHYGTNDMELGTTPGTALPGFFTAMSTLLDELEAAGTIAVLVGLTRRGDDPDADTWIATYNEVLRALAQQRQVPMLDVWWAIDPLPEHGLGPDGLHLRADPDGACLLDDEGLTYGYNMRNLIQLEALDRIRAALAGVDPDVDVLPPLDGDGSSSAPWVIDGLPFIHDGDTRDGEATIDLYDCSPSDRSGPELGYALELAEATALRIVALDREGVDVDVHLLDVAGGCVARADNIISGTLAAGSWRIAIDSWSDGSADYPGPYVLVVVPCDAGDAACAEPL